eukprot:CAMPEP_0175080558 /NCGR_PEP_ID=MMETSP0052_2-20121109/25585_1 /TAXON_ID=51329 ORGANISM="Polytomella parva, Strain SAG 63-3" /NCGR_SAMPLE_ID=MMETSP0052_2 /ASSEMBLY_ACC=CAM_ASM_000194 /LENGTH=257 /DNA_ID=CAMNT_0016351293 /DNA_START=465 /DNA_END=1238 /DNA_ORIENTATION=+
MTICTRSAFEAMNSFFNVDLDLEIQDVENDVLSSQSVNVPSNPNFNPNLNLHSSHNPNLNLDPNPNLNPNYDHTSLLSCNSENPANASSNPRLLPPNHFHDHYQTQFCHPLHSMPPPSLRPSALEPTMTINTRSAFEMVNGFFSNPSSSSSSSFSSSSPALATSPALHSSTFPSTEDVAMAPFPEINSFHTHSVAPPAYLPLPSSQPSQMISQAAWTLPHLPLGLAHPSPEPPLADSMMMYEDTEFIGVDQARKGRG